MKRNNKQKNSQKKQLEKQNNANICKTNVAKQGKGGLNMSPSIKKIVVLDRDTIGMDIDLSYYQKLCEYEEYSNGDRNFIKEKIKDADVLVFNKTKIDEDLLKDALSVKLLCITATGYDNVDLSYIKKRGIILSNVKGYSTDSVAQHTIAMTLFLQENMAFYDNHVKSGTYASKDAYAHFTKQYNEIKGKTWGIVGLGNIGKAVASLGVAFGATIIYYSPSGTKQETNYRQVSFEELLRKADIISVHCPLTENSRQLFAKEAFKKMKKSAIFINVARGLIVNEEDLYEALVTNEIKAAGLDVLITEPMERENKLGKILDSGKLLITPHVAWASVEARTECMKEVYLNIQAFTQGENRNRIQK